MTDEDAIRSRILEYTDKHRNDQERLVIHDKLMRIALAAKEVSRDRWSSNRINTPESEKYRRLNLLCELTEEIWPTTKDYKLETP